MASSIIVHGFRWAWDRIWSRAGSVDLCFHDLCHEAISRFFALELNIPEVAVISGHKDRGCNSDTRISEQMIW